MSIQKVRDYFKPFGIEDRIREFDVSSATVELAAVAVGVEGARIAKGMNPSSSWWRGMPRWTTAATRRSSTPRPKC